MSKNYYIDESGNTGDAKINETNFSDQLFFTLAAVSIVDEIVINKEIERLKRKYRINLTELKASKLYGKKDKFLYDLFFFLIKKILNL